MATKFLVKFKMRQRRRQLRRQRQRGCTGIALCNCSANLCNWQKFSATACKHQFFCATLPGQNGFLGKKKKYKKAKRTQKKARQGQPQPRGGLAQKTDKTGKGKMRRTKMRPGGQPARPGKEERAHADTHGTEVWRPRTRKGRHRRPHKTAPVHRESPLSHDGRYGKPDASPNGPAHAKPAQRTQPNTEAGETREGQPYRRAPNRYDTERAQRPCLGRVYCACT